MKRILCLILSLTFIFATAACAQQAPTGLTSSDAELSSVEESVSVSSESVTESEKESSSSQDSETEPDSGSSATSQQSDSVTDSSSASQQSSSSQQSASSQSSGIPVGGSSSQQESSSEPTTQPGNQATNSNEIRAIWFSFLEWQSMMTGKTKAQFAASFGAALDKAVDLGLNTVFVHARSHSDAFYDSDIFPWSVYASGKEGASPGYDPLAVMIAEAHSRGMKVEAWVNPYRIKGTTDTSKISAGNPAYDWLGTDKVKVVQGAGIYYNPADDEVIDLVVSGVKEIVSNYDVDGIHFDDYFYPTTDASFDNSSYQAYKSSGGTMGLADWRRDNVNRLVAKTYAAIKAIDGSCSFGISPTGNMDNNYSILYCDVYAWLRSDKYIDYICPQIYFGFDHAYSSYTAVLDQYNSMISNSNIKLLVGLAAYKVGKAESASAGAGVNEWVNNSDVLAREVAAARKKSHYEGFALYRYDSLFKPEASVSAAVGRELGNLEGILK